MSHATLRSLPPRVRERVLEARDPRFDGLFVVGLATSSVYCRPACPGRRVISDQFLFFESPSDAQHAGYRPCRRCRPDLTTSKEWKSASTHLASLAAQRIVSGALNGRSVASLAADLQVSERHLRRTLQLEMGVSPLELVRSHRLARAHRLLVQTTLSVTRVAFASGFQSLRRFNVVFREQYGMSPSDLRRRCWPEWMQTNRSAAQRSSLSDADPVILTIPYRAPLAWEALTRFLAWEAIPGVELVDRRRYARTVKLQDRTGYVSIEPAPGDAQLSVQLSASLLPVLPQLLMRLRRLLDLDTDSTTIDAHLSSAGLGQLVNGRPGVRAPGAFDGFEIALATILRAQTRSGVGRRGSVARVVQALGEPFECTGMPELRRLPPSAARIAEAGYVKLTALGVPERTARAVIDLASAVANGNLRLEPGDLAGTQDALMSIDGIGTRLVATILMRAAHWPDANPDWLPPPSRGAGVVHGQRLCVGADDCRPWRAYAAMHWWIADVEAKSEGRGPQVITRTLRPKPRSHQEYTHAGVPVKQRIPSGR